MSRSRAASMVLGSCDLARCGGLDVQGDKARQERGEKRWAEVSKAAPMGLEVTRVKC